MCLFDTLKSFPEAFFPSKKRFDPPREREREREKDLATRCERERISGALEACLVIKSIIITRTHI